MENQQNKKQQPALKLLHYQRDQVLPFPLSGEPLKCSHCFSIINLVVCARCGYVFKMSNIFPRQSSIFNE